jgi:ubiquinone/menaquinone biosynthesis C-methylase UbiE
MDEEQRVAKPEESLADHVQANRSHWDNTASEWVGAGERSWQQVSPAWGIWYLPEAALHLLPADMAGMKAIELGCGTAYVSAWMARRGADVVGIDNSAEQLKTARRLADQHRVSLTLMHGNAEHVPCPDGTFDFAISEYGAAIWCDPRLWIPEAHRLLRPGGRLTFLGTHPVVLLATPLSGADCDAGLHRPYFGMHKVDWREVDIEPGGVEFNLTQSEWLRLFRETGFEVLDYLELQAPAESDDVKFSVPEAWATRWPSEQVWKLRKSA